MGKKAFELEESQLQIANLRARSQSYQRNGYDEMGQETTFLLPIAAYKAAPALVLIAPRRVFISSASRLYYTLVLLYLVSPLFTKDEIFHVFKLS